ncbi:MAG TPA: hypothetical protein VK763_03390 [Terriglobales bacterium]|jgi:hypothetical protein|nr:hypothetical protein [Terriglobales bacterium]
MTCKDCGHAVSMDKICENPIQSTTDILKHMAVHNGSRAFAAIGRGIAPELEGVPSDEPLALSARQHQWSTPSFQSLN